MVPEPGFPQIYALIVNPFRCGFCCSFYNGVILSIHEYVKAGLSILFVMKMNFLTTHAVISNKRKQGCA